MSDQQEVKKEKNLKAVLVNLDLSVAEAFYSLARSGKFYGKKSPTAVARELIHEFIQKAQQVEEPVTQSPSDD